MKDFCVEEEPTATGLGRGRSVFSDRYSVSDWGEMSDHILNRDASLCLVGVYSFGPLNVDHISTHYLGMVEDGKVKELGECESPLMEMAVEFTQALDLSHADGAYDYDAYHEAAGDNCLIPLEVVFRNTASMGSSLRRCGEPVDYGLELDEWSDEVASPPGPVVEFSTRHEEQDRYLSRVETDDIAGKVDPDRLEELALAANHMPTERADEAGFDHEDGKIECLYHDGTVKVGGVVGTFSENRFPYDGQQVSKEVVRQYYKRVQPEWVEAVKDAKAEAIEMGEPNWCEHCAVESDCLPVDIVEALLGFHCADTNVYVDHDWFDALTIEDVVARVRDL